MKNIYIYLASGKILLLPKIMQKIIVSTWQLINIIIRKNNNKKYCDYLAPTKNYHEKT